MNLIDRIPDQMKVSALMPKLNINWAYIRGRYGEIFFAGSMVALAWYVMLINIQLMQMWQDSMSDALTMLVAPIMLAWILSGWAVSRLTNFEYVILDSVLIGIVGAAGVALAVLPVHLMGRVFVVMTVLLFVFVNMIFFGAVNKLWARLFNALDVYLMLRVIKRLESLEIQFTDYYEVRFGEDAQRYTVWDKETHQPLNYRDQNEHFASEWASSAYQFLERRFLKRFYPKLYQAHQRALLIAAIVLLIIASGITVGFFAWLASYAR